MFENSAEYQRDLRRKKVAAEVEYKAVTGILGAIESADAIESVAPNLREKYLLALLTRDAAIWKARVPKREQQGSGEADGGGLTATEAKLTKQVAKPPGPLNVMMKPRAAKPDDKRPIPSYVLQALKDQAEKEAREGKPLPPQSVKPLSPRELAKIGGEKTYTRNRPCDRCGTSIRYTYSAECVACKSVRNVTYHGARKAKGLPTRTPEQNKRRNEGRRRAYAAAKAARASAAPVVLTVRPTARLIAHGARPAPRGIPATLGTERRFASN